MILLQELFEFERRLMHFFSLELYICGLSLLRYVFSLPLVYPGGLLMIANSLALLSVMLMFASCGSLKPDIEIQKLQKARIHIDGFSKSKSGAV